MEVSIVLKLLCNQIKKPGKILVFHIFALSMEIKPDKPEIVLTNAHMHSFKIISHSLL